MAHTAMHAYTSPTTAFTNPFTMPAHQRHRSSVSRSDNIMPNAAATAQPRNNSTASTTSSNPPDASTSPHPQPQPQTAIRTRSIGWGPSVAFEHNPASQSDEDVMLVAVRLSNAFRRSSKQGADDLPSRPPARSFFRRLSTRLNMDHSAEKEEKYKAIKMPRGEYKKYFRRDAEGNYAGTEPQRDWEEEELMERYGEYQGVPVTRFSL